MNPPRQAPVPIFEEAADTGATPCAEGMLAATLALMTGFAEHCARPEAARARPAVPRLLAAKAASNLFFLAGNPALSEPMRATLWRLRSHWEALEQARAAHEADARPGSWPPTPATRH